MGQLDDRGYDGTDGGGQAGTVDAHVAGENEEVIAENVENAAGQDAEGGKAGAFVIAQEGRHHLIKKIQGEHIFNGAHIRLRQHQQGAVGAEEGEDGAVKEDDAHPSQRSQHHGADEGRREILVFAAVACFAAPPDAEEHAAAGAHEQAEAVDDVPDRCNDGQRRRSLRPLILPDHGHVHDRIDRGDHGGAEGGGQIFEINGFDPIGQKIHIYSSFLHENLRGNLHEKNGQEADISV